MGQDDKQQRRLSAELNGIGAVLDRYQPFKLFHILIHTDTAVGEAAARIVNEKLRLDGNDVQLLTASGLRTDSAASFRYALGELTKSVEELAAWRGANGSSTSI